VAALAEGAATAGHEVRVVAAIRGRTVRPSRPDRPERQAGVEVLRVRTWGLPWSQPLAPGYLSAARWPADIVYVHRPHPLADLAALRGPGRHLIVFHHADVQRQRLLKMFYQPLAHRVAARAAAAVVGARANLDHADDLGAAGRSRAVVIPFGVDAHRFAPPDGGQSPPERPEGFPASGPVGLFVGRLVSYKGLDVLLDAVAGTPNCRSWWWETDRGTIDWSAGPASAECSTGSDWWVRWPPTTCPIGTAPPTGSSCPAPPRPRCSGWRWSKRWRPAPR